jgi:hypothetical protein
LPGDLKPPPPLPPPPPAFALPFSFLPPLEEATALQRGCVHKFSTIGQGGVEHAFVVLKMSSRVATSHPLPLPPHFEVWTSPRMLGFFAAAADEAENPLALAAETAKPDSPFSPHAAAATITATDASGLGPMRVGTSHRFSHRVRASEPNSRVVAAAAAAGRPTMAAVAVAVAAVLTARIVCILASVQRRLVMALGMEDAFRKSFQKRSKTWHRLFWRLAAPSAPQCSSPKNKAD